MAGRNSVAIAIDARFGLGMQTISTGHGHHDDPIDGSGGGGSSSSSGSGEGNPRIIHLPNSHALLAGAGLYGDGMGFAEEMNVLMARKVRRAGGMGFQQYFGSSASSGDSGSVGSAARSKMSPRAITNLMSHLLYRRRSSPYYVEPVVVGLETVRVPVSIDGRSSTLELVDALSDELQSITQATTSTTQQILQLQEGETILATTTQRTPCEYKTIQRPFLCGTDMLGAQSTSDSFVCSGLASRSLHGTAEALWRPNLEGEELVEVCGRAFVSALERDCLSGYGAVVYLIQAHGDGDDDVLIIEYVLACRND